MNDPQLQFLQFVRFYKMLNELPPGDRPSDEVLQDDERLDRWYDAYVRKLANSASGAPAGPGRGVHTQIYEG